MEMLHGDSRYNVREFRHLRRRLFQLQREIDESGATMYLASNSPGTTDASRMDYYLSLRLKMEEASELQYVLDYFERLEYQYQWPTRSQVLFAVIVLISVILAFIAMSRVL